MTQENPPFSEEPKKSTLKLLLRSEPTNDVETLAGRIYVYPLRVRDMVAFGKLDPGDAVSQIRAFLPSIGSLTVECDDAPERVPLDVAIIDGISDDEIERVAVAYAKSFAWQTIRTDSQERKLFVQKAGETASAFFVRLLKAEVEGYNQSATLMYESLPGSSRGIFDKALKDLAEAATTLMEQMDERDRRADQFTGKQITIMV